MRATEFTARLLAASALSLTLAAPLRAAVNGVESSDGTLVSNPAGTTIQGDQKGVYSFGPALNLNNAGTIRGDGSFGGTFNADGGVVITGGPGDITNSGSISGAQFGITTIYFNNNGTFEGRAIGSTVNNSGSIIGDNNDGVRLIGGGTVTNSGYIAGRIGALADGVSMFAFNEQDTTGLPRIGTVNNLAGGTIEGNRFGIILSGGGTINNAGTINGGTNGATLIQTGLGDGKTGAVSNSGTINGKVGFNQLDNATVDNSGTILSATDKGITTSAPSGSLTVINRATGSISGATQGIFSEGTSLSLDNAGSIRGNGTSTSFRTPGGGVVATGGPAAITNSGSIFGAGFGITTGYYTDPSTNEALGRAIGSTVTNTGSVIGDTNDGIRLIGGGTLTNSGYIAGRDAGDIFNYVTTSLHSDGVSAFAFSDQNTSGMSGIASITNLAGGQILGNRFGVILSGGGTVSNSGLILGYRSGGVLIQGQNDGETGKTGSVTNYAGGQIWGGVTFYGLDTASLNNSGAIDGVNATDLVAAVHSWVPLTLTNSATGAMEGSSDGVRSDGATLNLVNAGSILGLGLTTGVMNPNGGIILAGGPATISNSGSIEGAVNGISTTYFTDPDTGVQSGRAIGSTITNSGSIIGDRDDGIRLIGGGTVTNSGLISGRVGTGADGVSMFAFADQDVSALTSIGTVNNLLGGIIDGHRLGVILSVGGTVNNAGTINGGTNGAIVIQAIDAGKIGTLANSGTVNGAITFNDLASASVNNSGAVNGSTTFNNIGTMSVTNSGAMTNSLSSSGGSFSLTNSGSISASDIAIYSGGPIAISNNSTGSIASLSSTAIYSPSAITLSNDGAISSASDSISAFGSESTVSNSGTIVSASGSAIRLGGSVTNSGTISGFASATAGDSAGIVLTNGSIANSSSGVIEGGARGIYFIYGAGSINNAGIIRSLNTDAAIGFNSFNALQAATVVNSGSILGSVQYGNNPGGGTLNNSGSITARGSGVAVYSIAPTTIVNSGSISTTGSMAISLLGTNTADTVTLLTGSSITGAVDGGTGSDTLRLSGTIGTPAASQTVGRFLNFETLNVLGGYWTAPANTGTFSSTTVNGGALAINGTITSPIAVNAGALLAGTGTINGATTLNSGGLLAPGGSSIGTLNIVGNVAFNAGSTFSIQTNPNGTADLLAVTGAVTIATGAGVQVLAGIATYSALGTSFTVLTATGGITGKFDKAVTDYNYYNVSVNVQKKGTITLNLTPNGKPLPSAASLTTLGAASAIDSLGSSNPIYLSVFNQSLTGARQAFSALSGSSYNHLDAILASGPGRLRLGLDSGDDAAVGTDWSGIQSLATQSLSSGSFMRRGALSLMMVGGRYVTRLASDSIDADVDTRFVASGVAYRSGRFQGLASAGAAWHDVAVGRTIAFPGFAQRTQSHYAAQTARIDFETSYALSRGSFGLAPYAGYSRIMNSASAFGESGAFAALTFQDNNSSADQLRAGIRARTSFAVGGIQIAPHIDASLQRTWSNKMAGRGANFVVGGIRFHSMGTGFDERMAAVDAGADVQAGPVTLTANYRGQLGNRWREHSARLSAVLRF